MAPKSFYDLPQELRIQIYGEILPRMLDMHLMLAPPIPKTIMQKIVERKLQMIPDGETRIDQPCDECTELANDAATLMQTCKLIRTELGPSFYMAARFGFLELTAAVRFVDNVAKELLSHVIQLSLAHPRDSYSSEKTEKRQLQTLIQSLPNLRQFRWKGVDRTADSDKKGTEWKPYELRKIITVLTFSPKLAKVFYELYTCTCCSQLRFTDDDGEIDEDEEVLDVGDEYELWKDANMMHRCLPM